jgi:endonuclease/exonuclease/phosphatase family metal-dependent hydrolase
MRSVGMRDTVDVAEKVENREFNTGHTFSTRPLRSGAHVDHIFASEEWKVLGWKQLVRMSGASYASPVLSDHNALRATLSLEGKKVDVGDPTPVVEIPPGTDPIPSPAPTS